MAKKTIKKIGCRVCGSTNQDLRMGVCFPCASKSSKKRKIKK